MRSEHVSPHGTWIEVSWEVTENSINKALQGRFREIIEQWEEDERVFSDTRDSLLQYFQIKIKIGICEELSRLMTQSVLQKLIPLLKAISCFYGSNVCYRFYQPNLVSTHSNCFGDWQPYSRHNLDHKQS